MAQRQKPIVGLDIDPAGIAVARVAVNGGLALEQAFTAPLEPGIVRDGEVVDVPALSEVLQDAWSEHKGLDRRVRIGVANQKVVVRTIELPVGADGKELDAAVRFQAQDALPMPLDQAVLDWQTLAVTETENGPRQRVLIAAARRDMIEPVLAAARGAGLRVEGIDLAAFAMIRALRDESRRRATRVLYAEIAGITNVAVAQGPQCLFARASGSGVEGLAVELAERRGLTLEHSRAWLQHVGADRAARAGRGRRARSSPTPAPSSQDGVRRIASEIRQSLDFHHMQSTGAPVTRAVLTGPALAIPGFAEAVGAEIGLAVTPGVVAGEVEGVRSAERHRRRRPRRRPAPPASTCFRPTSAAPPAPPAAAAASSTWRSASLALMLVLATSYVMAGEQRQDRAGAASTPSRSRPTPPSRSPRASPPTPTSPRCARRASRPSRSLATTRFDWAHALGELSRVLPQERLADARSPARSSAGGHRRRRQRRALRDRRARRSDHRLHDLASDGRDAHVRAAPDGRRRARQPRLLAEGQRDRLRARRPATAAAAAARSRSST